MSLTITLRPLGAAFEVPEGSPLQDHLFAYGVEFPCGGRGRCKGCRVRVVDGSLPVTPAQQQMLSAEELAAGWRLACQCSAASDLTLELAQWEAAILSDDSPFSFHPRDGYGIAIDVGTTTIVGQLLDLREGKVLAVRSALNQQARFGADIMSRVGFAVAEHGQEKLVRLIRTQTGKLVAELLAAASVPANGIAEVVLVGNTVMHHLFCDHDLTPLSAYPFESATLAEARFTPPDLGWDLPPGVVVRFLACIGSFVGSDILAGIVATRLHEQESIVGLVDLGTNGEIVLGNRHRMICTSTAAGPAFEGARISMGMRASTGAISEVHRNGGALVCHILGNVAPRGICGSGLVDAAAGLLDLGTVLPSGRMPAGDTILADPVRITPTDIRELQLAKGAIAAGLRLLSRELGTNPAEIDRVWLAGAFGNYVNVTSARRIGLLNLPADVIDPAGNTALHGAKLALFAPAELYTAIAARVQHVGLSELPDFQDVYAEEMGFPLTDGPPQ
jgi:uncharacterized 2Fe-2S/4Fe-4S cluster protein (DUF4445 family)